MAHLHSELVIFLLGGRNSGRQGVRRNALEILHQPVDAQLRVHFDQAMNVVGHDCQSDDFRPILCCHLSKQLFAAFYHRTNPHSAPVLWRPDAMVLAGIHNVVVRLVPFQCHEWITPQALI
jgi:hypothetical protein